MTHGDRVKEIRITLGLTMEKFGQLLGVTKSGISNVEKGNRNLTPQMCKLICSIPWQPGNKLVSEKWLLTGEGEMFLSTNPDEQWMQAVGEIDFKGNDLAKKIITDYVKLPDDKKRMFEDYILELAEIVKNSRR